MMSLQRQRVNRRAWVYASWLLMPWLLASGICQAAELGDDGLHKQDWFSITFRDIAEDMAEASAEGKRLAILIEQPGCIYCQKMHETVLSDPAVVKYVS